MKLRAEIVRELRAAITAIELTPLLLEQVKAGRVTKEQLALFYRDALGGAIEQAYLDFAERNGGVPSLRQVSDAAQAALFGEMAESSLPGVNAVRTADLTDDEIMVALRRAVRSTSKDETALKNYDDELKEASPRALRRKLRDARFDGNLRAGVRVSTAKRRLMVGRYRERLANHRASMIARAAAREAQEATLFAHWSDRAADGDVEALEMRKFWENRGDSKVRHSHVGIPLDYPDGLPLNESFVTEHGVLRYPLDSQGHAKDRDGCRCRLKYRRVRTKI